MDVEEFKKKYEQLKDNPMYKNFCSILDTKNQVLERMSKENQELKKQLDNYKNRYTNRLHNQLAEDVEPDFEDFYLAEIEGKANDYDELIIKQKEFIEWLEQNIENEEYCYLAQNPSERCRKDVFEVVLLKYKEIVGGNNDQ